MKKFLMILALGALFLAAGCGGGDDTEQAADKAAEAATEVAVHDCDGGCGMTKVAVDKLTVVDGKYLCEGCAKKAKGDGHDHEGHDHDGHSH